ncbi:heme-binding protein [Alteribacillus sp. YIM 98480]|uniref:GlcG/HbpS family heme-binding protein n=1 Tax=Alteribacillus sp. YIM 98480 TaxID=2606599 RepID=UPI00131EC7BF|nr:heme-binding protein [Alteribacillus sp. YIM 98480]
MNKLTLADAKKIVEGAEQKSNEIGISMVISVVDEGGNLIVSHRMDDAWIASIDISLNKAWTSVALQMPTEVLASATGPKEELYGLNTTNNGRLVVFGGGLPLIKDDKVIGAVGVSGSSVPNDIKVAEAAVKVFNEEIQALA